MKKSGIKVWELSLLLALCFALCEAALDAGRASDLSENIVRMHVVAASDEAGAQELKIRVRDAVLAVVEPILAEADSAAGAQQLLTAHSDAILSAAESAAEGESVALSLGRAAYGLRRTENYALPAGEYTSLRITIGEGQGHNWWGVIFPRLDVSGGYAEAAKYLSEDEMAIIFEDEGITLRLRFLEILEKLKKMLAE